MAAAIDIPQELQNLIDADWDLGILVQNNLQPENVDRLANLFEIAYRSYLNGVSQERIPCQDVWMPVFWNFRQQLEQVQDADQYLVKLDAWVSAYQKYRVWARNCNLTHEQLIELWDILNGDADDEQENNN